MAAARAGGGERPRLVVLRASEEELAEHSRILESIAQETKGRLVWRPAEDAAAA